MKSICAAGIVASGTLLLLSGPANAATAISGSVGAGANASIGFGPIVTVTDQHTDAAPGLPTNLSAQAQALAEYSGDTVIVDVLNTAVWQSSNQGQFTFNAGWDLSMSLPASNETACFCFPPPWTGDWTYTFTATEAGKITFDYDIVSTGQTFGIGGWVVLWTREGGPGANDATLTDVNFIDDPDGLVQVQGSRAVALAKGTTYTFWLQNISNIAMGGGSEHRVASMNGTIDWHISEVPEPSAWTLMIGGFGAVGFVVRHRARRERRRAVAA